MDKIDLEIISIIWDYMDKTLCEWCLIESKELSLYPENEAELWEILIVGRFYNQWNVNIKNFKIMNEYTEGLQNFDFEDLLSYTIIWYYDITAVLKYLLKTKLRKTYYDNRYYYFNFNWDNSIDIFIPNKPLHLYTEEEKQNLLDLLLKLK